MGLGYNERQKQGERQRHWSGWTYKNKSTNSTKTNGAGRRYILPSNAAEYWRRARIFKSCRFFFYRCRILLFSHLQTVWYVYFCACVDEVRNIGYSVRLHACAQACYMDWCWARVSRPSCAAWWYVCSGQRRRSSIIRVHHANAVQGMQKKTSPRVSSTCKMSFMLQYVSCGSILTWNVSLI